MRDEAGALCAWVEGFGFYFKHNARPLKGFATVNRKEHKGSIGGRAQPISPAFRTPLSTRCIVSQTLFTTFSEPLIFPVLSLCSSLIASK